MPSSSYAAWLSGVAELRALWARLRQFENAVVAIAILALAIVFGHGFVVVSRRALGLMTEDLPTVGRGLSLCFAGAAGLTLLHGWRASLRRVVKDPARDPWLVLGGSHRLAAMRELGGVALGGATLIGLAAVIARPTAEVLPGGFATVIALAVVTLTGSIALWLSGCVGAVCILASFGRGAALFVVAGGLATFALFVGSTWFLAPMIALIDSFGRMVTSLSATTTIIFSATATIVTAALLPAYVRQFEPVEWDAARGRLLASTSTTTTTAALGGKARTSCFWVGSALTRRTLAGRLLLLLAVAFLIGGISRGVREIDGPIQATLFVTGLLAFMFLDLTRRSRTAVGKQHAFLLVQHPGPPREVWQGLVAGHCATLAIAAVACYATIAAFHVTRASAPTFVALAAPVVEAVVLFGVADHLLGPSLGNDQWLREVAFWGAGGLVTVLVTMKTFFLPGAPLVLAAQSLSIAALAIWLGGRAPLRPFFGSSEVT